MRKIKEVLRLKYELNLGQRQIARSCSIGLGTVHDYLTRAERAGLKWPLPEGWDEEQLNRALFGSEPFCSREPEHTQPDFALVHEQRQKSKHVTLQLLWEEYRAASPGGYRYSRFCELYQRWRGTQDVVLRQQYKAGSEGASAYRELVDSGKMRELQNQGDRMGGYVGTMISAVDYLQAQRVRKKARMAIDEQLTKYDALIAPSAGASSRKISESFNRTSIAAAPGGRGGFAQGPALIPAGNLAGVPGLTIPHGFGQNNIPSGLQFLSGAWVKKTMLSLADAYQQTNRLAPKNSFTFGLSCVANG